MNHDAKCVTCTGAPSSATRVFSRLDERGRAEVQAALQLGTFLLQAPQHGARRGERKRMAHEGAGEERDADLRARSRRRTSSRRRRARPDTSRSPATMPIGRPPPRTLPYVARSARTPNSACAPPGCARKPVTTSSKTSAVSACCRDLRQLVQELARLEFGAATLHGLDEHRGELGASRLDRRRASPALPYSSTRMLSTIAGGMPGRDRHRRGRRAPLAGAPAPRRRCRDTRR